MQAVRENHQFYSPVTNWKSKNRRRQRYLNINTQQKVKTNEIRSPRLSKSLNSITTNISPTKSTPPSLPISPRSHSLKPDAIKISPSKPITSDIKKNEKITNNIKAEVEPNNTSFSQHIIETKKEITSPNLRNKKSSSFGHKKKKSDSSFISLFRSKSCRNLREKVPRINTNNISNTFDVSTLVDDPSSSFLSFGKNFRSPKLKSPELSFTSNTTACFSPTLSSTSQVIDGETSFTTLCNSPNQEKSFFSMNNDQLFKLLPKKIIRAIDNYSAQNTTTEISYKKGDFFFVISENESYYFVTNPSTKSSGYVSKYSFEQVDNFSKMNKIKSVLSPIVEKKESILPREKDPLSDRVMTICITEEIFSRNTQSTFPIEISKIDGTVALLNRSYDDICLLHNSLLECFSEYCGSNNKERILPFLPSLDAIFNHPRKSPRQILNNYLHMLIHLPNEIQFSYPFEQFFSIHKDDILSSIYVVPDLQFFATKDVKDSKHSIKVKVIAENKNLKKTEINILYVTPNIKYFDLFDAIESKFNALYTNLYYQNEFNEKVKVFGDEDLKLFFNSNNLSYVLWAK
ncbi:hypothetical protein BCR32DRAFT_296054 [Anaeromyces robustus]|uniref:SH3 domain-containing protein n=1 Tax=Anaeromyces robustus TaxID=1754192 RepID=A0A1Y1WT78_9FUNG|nr:hypothetical protein BCR32DRAFT_296054 [Anaeromyces robustus]|eukprot:ORX76733.1 hypothetical protein BCR32DRAFT_296054 [Anaeromyces robustus]